MWVILLEDVVTSMSKNEEFMAMHGRNLDLSTMGYKVCPEVANANEAT
jgi:hypothetical protein